MLIFLRAAGVLIAISYTMHLQAAWYHNGRYWSTEEGYCKSIMDSTGYYHTFYGVFQGSRYRFCHFNNGAYVAISRSTSCPDGTFDNGNECVEKYYLAASSYPENSCETDGSNPCDLITGAKTQSELDLELGQIRFERFYHSAPADPGFHSGMNWRHSFDARMDFLRQTRSTGAPVSSVTSLPPSSMRSSNYDSPNDACTVGWGEIKNRYRRGALASASPSMISRTVCELRIDGEVVGRAGIQSAKGWVTREIDNDWGTVNASSHSVSLPNGSVYTFTSDGAGGYSEVNNFAVKLEHDSSQWIFTDYNDVEYRFEDGFLVSVTYHDGGTLTMTYNSDGRLVSVSDDGGSVINLSYNSSRQVSSIDYDGSQIAYGYDADYNLISVTYENGMVRQYHYEDSGLPHHLTGITDERGIRYATWSYDSQGRAVSSEHSGGVDHLTYTYLQNSTVVNDSFGSSREYHLGFSGTRHVVTEISGDRCDSCYRGSYKVRTYDSNGYLDQVTDWEGNVTDLDFNARGLEVQRIEAVGTAQQRAIQTQWHTDYRLPIQITEPTRVVNFTYDSNGRLLQRTVTPNIQP